MAGKIQMKRGTYAAMDLNALYQGEWYYCTDTKQIYMAHGDGTGVLIGSGADAAAILAALGVTASATELNYVDGVTAAIQTQLDGKTPVDGWIAAGETWTYASASTFTVAADVSGKYQKGDKIKLTQTSAKYFYVLSAVYSAPNTTVTVTGGTDYTISNAAITSPYYSRVSTPFGFPGWFNYTPTASASGSMTFTSVTYSHAIFRIIGGSCEVDIGYANGTTGGTASASLYFTLPINSTSYYMTGEGWCYDDAEFAGVCGNMSNLDTMRVCKYNFANWGLGATRIASLHITYPI